MLHSKDFCRQKTCRGNFLSKAPKRKDHLPTFPNVRSSCCCYSFASLLVRLVPTALVWDMNSTTTLRNVLEPNIAHYLIRPPCSRPCRVSAAYFLDTEFSERSSVLDNQDQTERNVHCLIYGKFSVVFLQPFFTFKRYQYKRQLNLKHRPGRINRFSLVTQQNKEEINRKWCGLIISHASSLNDI